MSNDILPGIDAARVQAIITNYVHIGVASTSDGGTEHFIMGKTDAAAEIMSLIAQALLTQEVNGVTAHGKPPGGDLERSGWQPIETAPNDGTRVHLLFGDRPERQCFWDPDKEAWGQYGWHFDRFEIAWFTKRPTHWTPVVPLPPLPDTHLQPTNHQASSAAPKEPPVPTAPQDDLTIEMPECYSFEDLLAIEVAGKGPTERLCITIKKPLLDEIECVLEDSPSDDLDASAQSVAKEPSQEERRELAYTICPILKPWMDDDVARHPCRRCDVVQTSYGPGKPGCLIGAEEMAAAILNAGYRKRQEG